MSDTEEWRDIPEYEGYYQVSNLGRIKSLDRMVRHSMSRENAKLRLSPGQIMLPDLSHHGYYCVSLFKEGKRHVRELHTLIALAFLGKRPDAHHTHHINGNKIDNRLANLEYKSAHDHGSDHHYGENCHKAILTRDQVAEVRKLLNEGVYQKDIAKQFGVSRSTIGEIKRGASWKRI